jgi:hypothetical protein
VGQKKPRHSRRGSGSGFTEALTGPIGFCAARPFKSPRRTSASKAQACLAEPEWSRITGADQAYVPHMKWRPSSSVTLPASGFIEPCIPTAAKRAPAGADWLYELKLDGYRTHGSAQGRSVRIYSRRGADFTARPKCALSRLARHQAGIGESLLRTAVSARRRRGSEETAAAASLSRQISRPPAKRRLPQRRPGATLGRRDPGRPHLLRAVHATALRPLSFPHCGWKTSATRTKLAPGKEPHQNEGFAGTSRWLPRVFFDVATPEILTKFR